MSDDVYAREDPADRVAWRKAALGPGGRRAVEALQQEWGLPEAASWYRDNSRETLRDETFPAWMDHGALRFRPGIPTTSSRPRWALTETFADLFAPSLTADALLPAVEEWRDSHMSPGNRLRIATYRNRERAAHAVDVRLPDGTMRSLEPGDASMILRGVIEEWAPKRLLDPVVLSISEPGDKVYIADAARLRALNIAIDARNLLPDAVIVDIGAEPATFWVVEAVASDGPVTEDRRRQLLRWATEQRIPVESCRFLSAFIDRNDNASRRRLKDLAVGTFAWYSAEPDCELSWREIGTSE
ncbi:BsuBI/PstI family type II restriction endonuclease [Actinomadura monticuli]|uniref:BsuBI/PstI family type II restriction endonuclease n=1 Tax=Actinomadura monticuli TaxID=3097367 RepID=UPI003569D0FC